MRELAVAHAGVEINIAGTDEKRSVGWDFEPRIDLPDKVEAEDQRNSEAVFEEVFGIGTCTNRLWQNAVSQEPAMCKSTRGKASMLRQEECKKRRGTYEKSNVDLC